MSLGQEFDPSLLEGKDRGELVAIATSLGQKPPARAKKGDIITLIMQLVGADQPDGAEPAPQQGTLDAASTDDDDAAAASEAEAASQDDGARQAEADAEAQADSETETETETDEAGSTDAGRTDADRSSGNAGGQGNGNGGNQGGNDRSERNRGGRDDAPAGEGNEAPAETNQAQGEDGEGGNRRRRRRGRDRDRPREGEDAPIEPVEVEGFVDLREEGYGFLRLDGFLPSRDDAYISVKQTRQFGLRTGDVVRGKARPANRNEKNPALLQVEGVNGHPSHQQPARRRFEELTALSPDERLTLELKDDPSNLTVRIIDLVAPIGKGQRGLIVAPPKTGKTTVLKHVVRSIEVNHPKVELLVLLVDERPEEVTAMQRWVLRGTVAATTFDRPAEEATAVAELVIERAKRLLEDGKDVVVVLDGITRLARAYDHAAPTGGRLVAGGFDLGALHPAKRFFGAARKAEEGGSLTILATAVVETGSEVDELIFQEFTGTGNLEIKLDRALADREVQPPLDLDASGTRHEDLLFDRKELQAIRRLRTVLSTLREETGSGAAGVEMLTDRLGSHATNAAFLADLPTASD